MDVDDARAPVECSVADMLDAGGELHPGDVNAIFIRKDWNLYRAFRHIQENHDDDRMGVDEGKGRKGERKGKGERKRGWIG